MRLNVRSRAGGRKIKTTPPRFEGGGQRRVSGARARARLPPTFWRRDTVCRSTGDWPVRRRRPRPSTRCGRPRPRGQSGLSSSMAHRARCHAREHRDAALSTLLRIHGHDASRAGDPVSTRPPRSHALCSNPASRPVGRIRNADIESVPSSAYRLPKKKPRVNYPRGRVSFANLYRRSANADSLEYIDAVFKRHHHDHHRDNELCMSFAFRAPFVKRCIERGLI